MLTKHKINHVIDILVQGSRNAPSAGLERSSDADADDGAIPLGPSAPAMEEPEHADDGEVPAAMGAARRPLGQHSPGSGQQ